MSPSRADLVFTEAKVLLPQRQSLDGWVAVRDGKVDSVGEGAAPSAGETIDCGGRWVLPGLVDIHVHFRDPGFTHKEDFETGSAAAAAGGVTTVIDMPNTEGLVITPQDVERKIGIVKNRTHVDYGLYALLADSAPLLPDLLEMGIAGFKWMLGYESLHGTSSQPSTRTSLGDALEGAAAEGVLVGVHAEDASWLTSLQSALKNKGRRDPRAHGESRPPFTEVLAVLEAITLSREFGNRLHVHHLSSAWALDAIVSARHWAGPPVTVEVCPHHLFLTEDLLDAVGARGKVNPPLRSKSDVETLWRGLLSGVVDCIASDHAPHAPEEKAADDIWDAPSGLIGVETIFPTMYSEVVAGRLSAEAFVELTAERPAELVGLGHRKGKIQPGHDADLIVVDPTVRGRIESQHLHSKHPDSPFEGRETRGSVTDVFLRGRPIVTAGVVSEVKLGDHVPSLHGSRARELV